MSTATVYQEIVEVAYSIDRKVTVYQEVTEVAYGIDKKATAYQIIAEIAYSEITIIVQGPPLQVIN